ncbi:phosphotransferase [Paenibacillus sp. IITD108]|uniref:phosphotransferase n=1 Tax=Paenibacillus sp. IITD108 TaxID=3116649 RepID=UPI002F3E642A
MSEINRSELNTYLAHYSISEPWSVLPMESGMNNTTRKIAADQECFMLRIYNNHKNGAIVQVEHELLEKLNSSKSSIQTPIPVRNKTGGTFCKLEDGTLFALYYFIEGERPLNQHAPHIAGLGKAAGQLSRQLAALQMTAQPVYDPYYKLPASYEFITAELFEELMNEESELALRRKKIEFLMEQFCKAKQWSSELQKLPQQWIHGDIVINNTVASGEAIIAILDFEFAAIDLRAMEPAVIAADLLNKPNRLSSMHEGISLMMNAFTQEVSFTQEELDCMPLLMKLRLLDVFLHVVVRYRSGLSELELLCEIIDQTADHIEYIDNSAELREIFIVTN